MKNKLIAGAGLAACLGAWAADPVIMTVNGVDVPKSEFEYLYHKNSQQQLSPQPLDEYVEMFKIYKLKVADARAEGLDTTAKFRREMAQYRSDLSAPYMADSTFLNQLVAQAYERLQQEAEARHIMISKGRSGAEAAKGRHTIDSIHALLAGGADFEVLARELSDDRTAKTNGGYLGYTSAGRFPYDFETAVFTLGEGELSDVVESPVAYHIVKGGKKRKARGTVQASHIMKMVPQNAGPAAEKAAREAIDSIYRVVKADPSAFASLASTLSDDKGSARNGGQLPWFGAGEMVAPFDSAAFAMSVGEISEPVRTQFGWHIIHKTDQRGVPSLEEIRPRLLERITNPQDDRSRIIKAHQTETLARKHKGAIKNSTLNALKARIGGAGLDSLFYEACSDGSLGRMTLLSIDKKDVPVSEFANYLHGYRQDDPEMALSTLDRALAAFYNKRLVEAEQDWLEANQPEYRNLLNEYRDGSLLYEVSVEKVWDKASKDQEGLEHYFNMHRGDYTWTEPHVKGLLVNAVDREVAEQIRSRLDRVPSDSLTTVVRKEFAGKASAERIMTAKGSNPLVDYLMFGGPEVSAPGNYTVSFIYDARILEAPEEAADVRGMVISDYQNRLEADWIEELRGRYPIKVNEKVLKKVK